MRPFLKTGRRLSEAKQIFNYRLSRSRNTVENAFGILANTWRAYHRSVEYRVELADKVVKATVILHNYLRKLLTRAGISADGEVKDDADHQRPVKAYGYHNFLPDALEALEDDDDLVILSPNVDQLTDEEEFNDNNILIADMPNDIAGQIQIIRTSSESYYDSSDDELLSDKQKLLKMSKESKSAKPSVISKLTKQSGYHRLPQERMHWCEDEDLEVQIISAAIPRNRYYQIKQNIHFANNSNIDKSDKMFKLRPLMNISNEKFKPWGSFQTYLYIDEAMVRYFEHHSAK
ncbi:hypothetical protein ILUMI_15655 [Ignelater luminosus]|uniref:DDE Tnp4 domain-containing protein n=1 Tax=Ignelater luminosus TaxID=2038154 RepID=A0A8K0G9P9_IGNLU|nr:hypothetical protein ILUMI_15655 [Ignelater luminosus]